MKIHRKKTRNRNNEQKTPKPQRRLRCAANKTKKRCIAQDTKTKKSEKKENCE